MHSLMLLILIGDIDSKMDEVLGYMNTELEGRFSKIRSQETNLGMLPIKSQSFTDFDSFNRHYVFSLVLDNQRSKNNLAKGLSAGIKNYSLCDCVFRSTNRKFSGCLT